jgi:4-oxalomesaconate hydratase
VSPACDAAVPVSSDERERERALSGMLVVSAHAADFVWRGGGAMAAAAARGESPVVVCLSEGARGESAHLWRQGKDLKEVIEVRREEASRAAEVLGAEIEFLGALDYPLEVNADIIDRLIAIYRRVQPDVVLTHSPKDPYNFDHPEAHHAAMRARVYAQAIGYPAGGDVIGAPPVFAFEPHQPEQCGFVPDVLLDITEVFDRKRAAMECMAAQTHLWEYYTDLARRRGTQARRNSGPNLGLAKESYAEAFERVYPQVTKVLE